MLIWTWVLTILGMVLLWVMMLADAMSSGPRLALGLAMLALPLPLIALALAGLGLQDVIRAGGSLRGYFGAGIPLLLCAGMIAVWIGNFWPRGG